MENAWHERRGTIKGFPLIYSKIGTNAKTENSGYGKGKRGFDKLLSAAWDSAVKQGKSFASHEYCPVYCKTITVVFVCSGEDAKKAGGEYCGKKMSIPVKTKAKE
jgi:hypothetical protein